MAKGFFMFTSCRGFESIFEKPPLRAWQTTLIREPIPARTSSYSTDVLKEKRAEAY
jgi:hypothetical protein